MNFARLLLEIRRRAAALPDDVRQPQAIERIARDVLDSMPECEQSAQVRRTMSSFLGLGEGDEFDAALLDQMTPELAFRLDLIARELLQLEWTRDATH